MKKTNTATTMRNISKIAGYTLMAGSTVIGVLSYLNSRDYRGTEQRLRAVVDSVWNEIKDDIVKELRLKEMPELMYESPNKANNGVMYTIYDYRKNMVTNQIIETFPIYKIFINLELLSNTINSYQSMIIIPSKEVTRLIIRQLLMHESRHIWQAQSGFHDGTIRNSWDNLFKGHGESSEENDANSWACHMASNDKERVVGLLMKKDQEISGKMFASKDDLKDESRKYFRAFNPFSQALTLLSK